MRVLAAFALVALTLPAHAQYVDEEQQRDHEQQDRRYQERAEEQARSQNEDDESARAAFLQRAEDLIRDRNYHSTRGRNYRVQTDDPRLNTHAVAELLDSFRAYFEQFWSGRLELAPYDETSRVFLFYSFRKFNELLEDDFRFRDARPMGHYGSPFDVITVHTDAGALADALVHEAAHQLVSRRLFAGEGKPSLWAAEGLASYFGYTFRDSSGVFRTGQIGGKAVELTRDARSGGKEIPFLLKSLRKAFKAARSLDEPLAERVVDIRDPEIFYGEDAQVPYGVSWLLVHWALHAEEGAHAEAFLRYLEAAIAGQGGADRLLAELGRDFDQLDDELEDYLKGLSAR